MPRPRSFSIHAGVPPMDQWPAFDTAGLSDARRRSFENNRTAVALYIEGASPEDIRCQTHLDVSRVRKLVQRCLQQTAEGEIVGMPALVPYRRRHAHQRHKALPRGERGGGYAGVFELLLRLHPRVRIAMEEALRGKAMRPGCARHYAPEAYAAFLRACAAQGLGRANCYPFNTQSLAVQSVRKFVRDYITQHLPQIAQPLLGERVGAKLQTGDERNRPSLALYERVECDAHLLDHSLSVMVRHPGGHYVERRLHRLWIIVLMEVRSRAVLGYSLSLERQPSSQDLLDAVHMALSPWRPYQHTGMPWRYSEKAGFPSGIRALQGVGFRELSVDGARMNLPQDVISRLETVLGARVTCIARGNPNDRPYIERYFQTLEEMGFHRMHGTTGSHPHDPRRLRGTGTPGDPHRLDWTHLPAILDHLIAEYNGTPHSSLGEVSPLDYLAQMAHTVHAECRATPQSEIDSLQFVSCVKTIRGNLAQGRAPYIKHEHGRYGGGPLSLSFNLIGQKVRFRVNAHDARSACLFTLGGEPLGKVWAAPPWHELPHSLRLRGLIQRQTQARARHLALHGDPIHTFVAMSHALLEPGSTAPNGYLALQRSVAALQSEQRSAQTAKPDQNEHTTPEPRPSSSPAHGDALPRPRPAAPRQHG